MIYSAVPGKMLDPETKKEYNQVPTLRVFPFPWGRGVCVCVCVCVVCTRAGEL